MSFKSKFIEYIFDNDPKEIHYYSDKIIDCHNINIVTLSCILLLGSYKLFGNNITPSNITNEQFLLLNKYMNSIGYNIHYEDVKDNINIYFKKLPFIQTKCSGFSIYI